MNTTTAQSPQMSVRADTTRKHIRGSSLLLTGRVVSLGLNFAVQVLTVRYLSKSDYGAFAYAISVVSMASSVSLFGLEKAITRFVPIYQEKQQFGKMFGAIIMMMSTILGLGLAIVLLVFTLQGFLSRSFVNDPLSLALLLILIALAPAQSLSSLFQGMLAIFASPRAIFFRRHLLGPGLKLTAVLLVILTHSNVYFLAFGYLVGGILGVVIYVPMLWQILHKQGLLDQFNPTRLTMPFREILGFSAPLLTTDLLNIVRTSGIIIMLEYFRSTTDVAEFRAVLPLAGLNMVVMESFKFLFMPMAARMFAHNNKNGINDLYWRTAIWIAVISFPIFAITFSLAKPVTVTLFGSRYAQSGIILALLSLGTYFNAALGFNALTLRVYGRVRTIVFIDIVTVVFSLGLSLWLIPHYGALGAAVGVCAVLMVQNLLNHGGLLLDTGVELFQWRYLRVYATILLAALGLLVIQTTLDPAIFVSIGLAAAVSLLLLRVNRHVLAVGQMFPELFRLPFMRRFLG